MTVIDLSRVEPCNYLSVIANTLDAIGYALKAVDFRTRPPKDITEAFTRLPDDVCIRLWEVPDDTLHKA